MKVRPAAVAGRFYPADPARLAREVEMCLLADPLVLPPVAQQLTRAQPAAAAAPRALVVPHAGYIYSGPTAGVAYRTVRRLLGAVDRVVLLGPAHYVAVSGVAASSADAWRTPLGEVPLDTAARDDLLARGHVLGGPRVAVDDVAHQPEHSLEVQVPFLQNVLPGVPLVPLLVGTSDAEGVAALLDPWWQDPRTLLVVSSDLSHYEPVQVARGLDARTAAAVCRTDAAAVGDRDACGCRPLRAVLRLAARDAATVRLLDLRTSADTAGDPDRVVGYGAFALAA